MMIDHKIRVLFLVGNLRPSNGVTSFVMTYFWNIDHDKFVIDFALLNDVKTPYYKEIKDLGGKIYILPPIKKLEVVMMFLHYIQRWMFSSFLHCLKGYPLHL